MTRIFPVLANAVAPASVTIPDDAYGYHELEVLPPSGHGWTQFDPDAQNGVTRSTDYPERISRLAPFQPGTRVMKVQMDLNSGTFLCILK